MTKEHAVAAARHMIVTFHKELPDIDWLSVHYLTNQFQRDLSAAIQCDIDGDRLLEIFETLDRMEELYYFTGEYSDMRPEDYGMEYATLSNVLDTDLWRLLEDYTVRAPFYFEAA